VSAFQWIDGQPNVVADVANDQTLQLEDGSVVHVKHDPLSPPDHPWYVLGVAELRGHSFEQREDAKSVVEALQGGTP
jgi:hypothetical protein